MVSLKLKYGNRNSIKYYLAGGGIMRPNKGDYNEYYQQYIDQVKGDDIFAYVSTNSGLKIHRYNCNNAEDLMANFGYRVLKAEWASSIESNFTVTLYIFGIDEGVGVIERITKLISSRFGVNIKSFNIEGNEGTFEARISLVVSNKEHLNSIIKSLSELPGISHVRRADQINQN